MDCSSLSKDSRSGTISLTSGPEDGDRGAIRRQVGSSPMLRDTVHGMQSMLERADETRERSKNLLLKDVNCEKSSLQLWEDSPPQLSICCPSETNKRDPVGFVNKSLFIQNSDSSFVVQEEEQPVIKPEPSYNQHDINCWILPLTASFR